MKRIEVKEIVKMVDAYGKCEYLRPDGTIYDMKGIGIYKVKTKDGRVTLGAKLNGVWYEAFTRGGVNTIRVV